MMMSESCWCWCSGRNSKVDDGLPLHSAVSKYGNPGAGADAADHCEAC